MGWHIKATSEGGRGVGATSDWRDDSTENTETTTRKKRKIGEPCFVI